MHRIQTYLKLVLPMLAVCYGAQYLAHFSGGEVAASNTRNMRANLSYIKENGFL
jgi:GMP synthase (glutamine-hydrolysing)